MSKSTPKKLAKAEKRAAKATVNLGAEFDSLRKTLKKDIAAMARAGPGKGSLSRRYEPILDYTRAIVDPEGCGTGAGVPDEFADPTMRYQSITEVTLGTGVGSTVAFDGGNMAQVIVTPDPRQHVWLNGAIPAGSFFSLGTWLRDGGKLRRMDMSSSGVAVARIWDESFVKAQLLLASPSITFPPLDIAVGIGPFTVSNSLSTTGLILGKCTNASGNAVAGIPVVANDVVYCNTVNSSVAAVTVFQFVIVTSDTSGTLTTTTSGSVPAASPGANTGENFSIAITVPAGAVRLVNVALNSGESVANFASILSAEFVLKSVAGFTIAAQGAGDSVASGRALAARGVPEYKAYSDGTLSAFRLVSMSEWLQYDGGVLNDNGRIVAAYVNNRSHPYTTGQQYADLSSLASIKRAHDGQLPRGLYAVWKPEESVDTRFEAFGSEWGWQKPYLSASVFQPTAAGQQVRLRVVANWEMKTLSNLYQKVHSTVDPNQIAMAHRMLANFPLVMENEFHLAAIGDFLINAAKTVAKWAPAIGTAIGGVMGGPAGAGIGMQAGTAVQSAAEQLERLADQDRRPVPPPKPDRLRQITF